MEAAGVAEKEHLFVQVVDKSGNEVSSGNGGAMVNTASGQVEKGRKQLLRNYPISQERQAPHFTGMARLMKNTPSRFISPVARPHLPHAIEVRLQELKIDHV